MAEIQTADGTDGVTTLSPQEHPTQKNAAEKDSESSDDSPKTKPRKGSSSSITSNKRPSQPEVGAQGRIKTQWDNPDADPNLRKHIGEDPTGESNALK